MKRHNSIKKENSTCRHYDQYTIKKTSLQSKHLLTNLYQGLIPCVVVLILQFATSASAGVAAPPSTIYVEPSGSEDGSAWGNSFSSIQTAITGANSADEVWVAAGTYTESITMKSGVNVYGGFDNSDTLLSDRDHETNVTIIDASSLAAASKYHVVTFSSVTAILDGFTITGGAAAGSSSDQEGGGIYLVSADDSEINNCIITANSAIGAGAGIYGTDSSITISNCVISNNVATSSGGGIMFESDSVSIITGSRIVGNYSGYEGGGINIDTNSGFNTLDEALAACPADGAIRLQLPNYSTWTGTIDQAVGLNADGGTATLGGPPI